MRQEQWLLFVQARVVKVTKLKDNQTLSITNINVDNDNDYTIEEQADGWDTSIKVSTGGQEATAAGKKSSGTLTKNSASADFLFTNTKSAVTTKVDPATITPKSATETATVTDTVTVASGLTAGGKYAVKGKLVEKSSSTEVAKAEALVEAGNNGSLSTTLTYENVPVGANAGKSLVSLVTIGVDDVTVASHEDLNDADQTVTIGDLTQAGTLNVTKKVDTSHIDVAIGATDLEIEAAELLVKEATSDSVKAAMQERVDELKEKKEKLVKDKDAMVAQEFEFVLKLTDAERKELTDGYACTQGDGTAGTIKSGGTFKLKDSQTFVVTGMPAGSKFEVEEKPLDNWKAEATVKDGDITENVPAIVTFTNTALGTFSISKAIEAANGAQLADAQKNTEFTFTVHFFNTSDVDTREEIEGVEYAYSGSKTGTVKNGGTITLKGGEKVIVEGMPVGTYVLVSEAATSGWTRKNMNLGGYIRMGKNVAASYTNVYNGASGGTSSNTRGSSTGTGTTRAATAKTADPSSMVPIAMLAAGAACAATGALRRRR